MTFIWLFIVILLGILEITTSNLVSIWFVISGLISMIVSCFTNNIYIQFIIFVLLGIILMPISTKIYKKISSKKVPTNIDRIIGMKGVITKDISMSSLGEVKVDGKYWTCYSDEDIHKGEFVKVLSINSTKLKVKKWEN